MKRYEICKFPSLYGTPWESNFKLIAIFFAICRWSLSFVCFEMCEIRAIDTKTDEHFIVW